MGSKRDTQRARVYRAEKDAFYTYNGSGNKQLLFGKSFSSLKDMRIRVKNICSSKWWRDKSYTFWISLNRFEKQLYGATAYSYKILIGKRETDEWVLIHELAHVLQRSVRDEYSDRLGIPAFIGDTRGHGRSFCRIYLAMVRRFIGVEAYNALRLSFKHNNVKYARSAED
ncbi:hypothetical protein LCGC14_2597340 [marine sediment metagenome]|uniref:Uncharacterized protein n=1 Tax=marine sediment metagenome TaxID=412755 RepID=A0A0F9AXN2_9ZZZZ